MQACSVTFICVSCLMILQPPFMVVSWYIILTDCELIISTGKTFRIKGSESKPMQRIGAKNQNCLLHISKWGITLALERTRSVLAQWPLTTIRNYESMDRCEFSFEAGRRSPMGEGKYSFYTLPGEDNRIFDTIDKFASQRLNARGGAALVANSEEEMSRAYDQLRFSVLNFHSGTDQSISLFYISAW